MTPQEFEEQLDKFMIETKILRVALSDIDKKLNYLDGFLMGSSVEISKDKDALEIRRDTLIKREFIRNQLKEYEKIIQRLKSTL